MIIDLPADELALVHRYFDGELDVTETLDAEELLRIDARARLALDQLRRLERRAHNEVLAATSKEDFSNWWAAVEQQMEFPSLERPPDLDTAPTTIVDDRLIAGPKRRLMPWMVAAALGAAAIGTAALVLLTDLL